VENSALQIVRKIVAEFGTSDVYAIAETAGVKIVYENWHPVTIGEFERKTLTIRVNRRALENDKNGAMLERKIIAHELGHFFAAGLKLEKKEEEAFAHAFAADLTGIV
jgi:predicted SprT family Zn-dependent metalloprotease